MGKVRSLSNLISLSSADFISRAADASSHLFFAYLRSLSPDSVGGVSGISQLPRSLQALLSQTEYPPETPTLMQKPTTRVVMIVKAVSPTPFALLRRAKNFEYRDDDEALQAFSNYEDPVSALTDECRRVLNRISAANQSALPTNGAPIPDGAWSRFEDMGFTSLADTLSSSGDLAMMKEPSGLFTGSHSRIDDLGRPTTPSWADFLSSGFPNDPNNTSVLLPPDKQLPPLQPGRVHSSQSHVRNGLQGPLEPGELASINSFDLDETFWWVWMTSLAGEETPERKAVFGRCALIETQIPRAPWLVIEEQVKGASPDQEQGMYLAEKKSRFSFTKRARFNRRKTAAKNAKEVIPEPFEREKTATPMSRIDPEQQAKVHAAAVKLAQDQDQAVKDAQRRGRMDDTASMKTNSALTLQPLIMTEAAPALKWTNAYDNKSLPNDKDALRSAYLRDPSAGRGRIRDDLATSVASSTHLVATNGSTTPRPERQHSDRELPALPSKAQPSEKEQQSTPAPPATPPQQPMEHRVSESTLPSASFDEKPPLDNSVQHPAFRQQAPQVSPESSKTPSPEAGPKSSPPHKLHKKGGVGLKKLFIRKKETGAIKSKVPVAVGGGQPTQFPKASDRASTVQSPTDTDPLPDEEPSRPSYQEQDISHSEPRVTANEPPPYSGYHSESSRIGTAEQVEANREFSRFDQGPLEDVPAYVPEDSSEVTPTERSPMPEIQQSHPRVTDIQPSANESPQETSFETPAEEPQQNLDSVSEASDDYQQTMPVTDRWARIRKNAAERAQRLSEEQSGRSRSQSAKTDDGETSGEETIESRVARIKARVAELTGKAHQLFDRYRHTLN
jgi:hypothetical protein